MLKILETYLKHSFVLTLTAIFMPPSAVGSSKVTLDQVLDMAMSYTATGMQIVEQTYQSGKEEVRIYRAQALPKLDFNLTSLQANEYVGGAAFPVGEDARSFGHRHEVGLSFVAPIFSFGRLSSVYSLASIQSDIVESSRELARSEYIMNILQSYSNAIVTQKNLEVATWEASYARRIYEFTHVEKNRGGATQIDYLRAKSQLVSAEANEVLAREEAETSLALLKVDLGQPSNADFMLDLVQIPQSKFFYLKLEKNQQKPITTLTSRTLALQRLQVDLLEKQETFYHRSYWPSLSLIANSGQSATDISGQISPTGEGSLESLAKVDRWNHYIGLRLDWQLFSGLETSARAFKASADYVKAKLELSQSERRLFIEREGISARVQAVEKLLNAARQSEEAMKQAFEKSEQDYKSGSLSYPQFVEVSRDFAAAQRQVMKVIAEKILVVAKSRLTSGVSISGE
ncbi:MAG: TolC family protein [Zetaproteobacteria bacterium]|nr:TolC family protein [Zetaproteobacteria bacterium]